MITKNFSQLCHHDLGVVIRCVAVGRAKTNPYIIAGCIDSSLYIFDKDCHLVQKVTFKNWVRCCAMGDIDGDGDAEIVAGSGDKTVKILKLIGERFQEIRSLDFPHIVNACAIADVTGDGIPEILIGTWGSIVYMLDPREYKILWQKEFRGWINFICPGDVTGSGRTDLLVGTRDGIFYVVEGTDGHVIWDYTFPKEINAAALADVDNSGVPSILVGGNSEVLTIFNSQGNIQREISLQNRILSIAVGDVDGDHANEIVIGCSDNTLRVLENRTRALEGISLKWRGKFDNTIRGIQILDLLGNGVNHIIFGGYNKVIQAIQDFQWGKKPLIEIYPVPLAIVSTGAPTGVLESQFFVLDKINRIEDLLANSQQELMDFRAKNPQPGVSAKSEEEIPKKITFPDDLLDNTITAKNVEATVKTHQFPRTPSLLKPKITPEVMKPVIAPVITPVTISETQVPVSFSEIQAPIAPLTQYCNQVVEHLKQVGVISSKAKLMDAVKSLGIPEDSVENVITKLLDDQRLAYSRTAPRGYGLIEGVPIAPIQVKKAAKRAKPAKRAKIVEKPAIASPTLSAIPTAAIDNKTEIMQPSTTPLVAPVPLPETQVSPAAFAQYCNQVVEHLKQVGVISSKAKLMDAVKSLGIPEDSVENVITKLLDDQRLAYSRTAPRGYGLIEGVPTAPIQVKKAVKRAKPAKIVEKPAITPAILPVSPASASNYQAGSVNAEIERAYAAVKIKGLIPSKPELSKVLEQAGIAANLIEAIINNLKDSGRITYSRSAPRGYSAV